MTSKQSNLCWPSNRPPHATSQNYSTPHPSSSQPNESTPILLSMHTHPLLFHLYVHLEFITGLVDQSTNRYLYLVLFTVPLFLHSGQAQGRWLVLSHSASHAIFSRDPPTLYFSGFPNVNRDSIYTEWPRHIVWIYTIMYKALPHL